MAAEKVCIKIIWLASQLDLNGYFFLSHSAVFCLVSVERVFSVNVWRGSFGQDLDSYSESNHPNGYFIKTAGSNLFVRASTSLARKNVD